MIETTPATVPVEIVSRRDGAQVLFRADVAACILVGKRIKAVVEIAVKARADLVRANLAGANLAGADLVRANLAGADLAGAYLARADLARANLARANLADANLADANLAGANLAGANLARANLARANLAGADLAGANLAGAYLAGANLAGAYLAGANLADANGEKITLTERGILIIHNIGSELGTLMFFATEGGLYARRGCFGPSPVAEFIAAVNTKHGDNRHGRAYRAAVTMAEAWAEVTP